MNHIRMIARSRQEKFWLGALFVAALVSLILDQTSKIWVESVFALHESKPVIPGFFSLTHVRNLGAAWSILEGHIWLLLTVACVMLAAMIFFFRYLTDGWKERYFAMGLVIGGIFGNSIDRIWRGAVVDFFDFQFGSYHYPVFNIADCAICIGIGIFLLSSFLRPEPEKKAEKSADHAG